jgi:hypothetical protein
VEQGAGDICHLGGVHRPVVKEPGKQKTQQVGRDPGHGVLGGQVLAVDVIGPARVFIRGQQALRQLGYG